MSNALKADPKRNHVRFPRVLSLRSAYDYLKRAYPAEPQPVKRIDEALTFLEDRGFWFVEKLQCRSCLKVYVRSGHAANHKCSSAPLGATSSERAKSPRQPLEGPTIPDHMSWDPPDAETSFEHVTEATDGQPSSERERSADCVRLGSTPELRNFEDVAALRSLSRREISSTSEIEVETGNRGRGQRRSLRESRTPTSSPRKKGHRA